MQKNTAKQVQITPIELAAFLKEQRIEPKTPIVAMHDEKGNVIPNGDLKQYIPSTNSHYSFSDIFDSNPKEYPVVTKKTSQLLSSFWTSLPSPKEVLASENIFKAGFALATTGGLIATGGLLLSKTGVGATVGLPIAVAGATLATFGFGLMLLSVAMNVTTRLSQTVKKLDKDISWFEQLAPHPLLAVRDFFCGLS